MKQTAEEVSPASAGVAAHRSVHPLCCTHWVGLPPVPLTLLGLPGDQVSLTGTLLSFVLFLACFYLDVGESVRWSDCSKTWQTLGDLQKPTHKIQSGASSRRIISARAGHCRSPAAGADNDPSLCSKANRAEWRLAKWFMAA